MGNFNVDELPDLNEKNSKPKAFNVDELPDLKKKDEPNLKSGSNGSSSSNTTSKSESGFSNGKSTTSQVKPVNNMPIEQINNIGNIFQKPTEKKQEIPIPFDAKKTQPIAGTKLPVPEKVDYAVNKEGKDIQGVEWGAFKEYEVSQRALSEVDKKLAGTNTQTIHINSIGAFTSPVDNKQFEQELSKRKEQLTQERNPLKIKADAVLEVTNNQVEKIIDVAKNKYGLDHFSYTNKDGEKVADPTKVEAWAKSIAKKAGLPEDSYAERLLYNQMKAQVDFKPVAEKIDQEVKTIYKSKYGKSFDDLIGDDQKKYFSQFKEGKEIEERFKLQEKSVLEQTIVPRDEQTKQLGELYKQSAESLNAEFESLHSQQSQKAEIAKSLYEKGTLPYETANQQINEAIRQQKALQSDFAKKLEDVTTEYLTNNSYINAKYNKQAKRMIDELAKSADREYRKVAEKYAQGYKIPDSLKKEYESVYKQAYSKVTKSEDERLYEKDKGKLLSFTSSLYNQHFMHGLGGAIKSFSTALGLRSGEILGDNIQSRRSFSNQEIKDASDFVNPVKFIGSAGETIGGMLPMIAGQTTISALTGGMSIPAQMALQGIYGVTTEALQSAGANKDQIFAQTGSVTEANKAFNKTMTGYLALFPLATIDGLPFIEKATLGIKNWAARAGAKSIVETAGETLQETMQNKVDKIATDIKEEDLKSMFDVSKKDFYQSGLNVAPTTLIMGGAPTIFHQGIKEYRTAMGKAYATKNMLADVSGSAREQFIHELVTNRGSDFTKAYATALFNNGEISGIELDRLHDNIKTAEKINQNSEALGLTKPQARIYAAMQFDLENSKRDAFKMDYTDSAVKSAHEQIINDKQTRLNDFLATKKGDYAVVTNADLSQQVLTLDEFDKLAENPEFIKALAGGDVQAFIETTDKKGKESKIISDSINAKIKEQNTAKPSTNQQTPTELTVGLSDKEGNKITRISEDGNDIFVQDKDGNIKTYTKDEADKIFGTELLPNPIVNQNQVQDGKEQKAEGQENVLTGTDQKVEPQVQEDKTNTPAPLESLTAEQKKEVAKDVEAKVLKQKAIDGTLDEYLLGLYNEKIQKENENKGTPVEPVDTGQKQDNGTGVQQPQQDDKSIQQGSGTGQNMPDQKEVSGQVQAKEVKTQAGSVVEGDVETYFNENTRSTQDSKYNPDLSGEGEMALLEQENRLLELGADRIQAHGLAKGSIGQQFKDLINILTKGLDSRGGGKLYTAPLVMPTELRAGAGSALGTGGGTAYTDGGFIILAREGVNEIRSIDDIGGVLVNQAVVDSLPELVDRLKKQFPNISIESYSNAPKAIESIKSKAVEELLNDKGTPNEVNQPVQQDASTADKQGNKEAVQQGVDATGQGNAEGKSAVLEQKIVDIAKAHNNTGRQTKVDQERRRTLKVEINDIANKLGWTVQLRDNGNIEILDDKGKQRRNRVKKTKEQLEYEKAKNKKAKDKLNRISNFEFTSIPELVRQYFALGGKINTSELHEAGITDKNGNVKMQKEWSIVFGMQAKTAPTISQITERILGYGFNDLGVEQEVRDAIIKVLGNYTKTDLQEELDGYISEYEKQAGEQLTPEEQAEKDAFYAEQKELEEKKKKIAEENPELANEKTSIALEDIENSEFTDEETAQMLEYLSNFVLENGEYDLQAIQNDLNDFGGKLDQLPIDLELYNKFRKTLQDAINNINKGSEEQNKAEINNDGLADIQPEKQQEGEQANRRQAEREFDAETERLKQAKDKAQSELKNKRDELSKNAQAEMFGDIPKANELFGVEKDLSKENADAILAPYVRKAEVAEKALKDHLDNKENYLSKYDNQERVDEVPFSAGTKPNIKTISKKAFDKLIKRLIDAFPNVKVFQDENTLKSKLKELGVDIAQFLGAFNNKNVLDTEKVKFLRTKDGTIYGAKFPDGSIYISPENLNANTPIHEFGHIWEQAFGARFRAGVEILKQSAKGRALIEQVRNNPFYNKMTQEQIEREALVVAIGNKGEQLFGASNYEKLKQWISDLFKAIKEKLGIKQKLTADETLENFTKGVVGELLGGKVLNEEIGKSNKTSGTVDLQMDKAIKQSADIKLVKDKDGNLLAPNGKKSNLNETQWKIVRTDAFKNWFGDWENNPKSASKVVDENGEPLVVYHGTNKFGFTEFDNVLNYFSSNKFVAKTYEDKWGGAERGVYEVFLNIKNIEEVNANGSYFDRVIVTEDTMLSNESKLSVQGIVESILGYRFPNIVTNKKGNGKTEGVKISNVKDDLLGNGRLGSSDVYVALNPNQIKLADGTNTTFNPETNDIRFKFDSNTINDDVREMKAAGLSEDRIREVLSLSGNTQEEIDKALSGEGEVFGIKKAMAGEEFIQSHPLSKMSDKEVYEAGKVLVDSGLINPTELIDEVVAGVTKVLTAEQTAVMIYHRAQLSNILDLQLSELANANPQTAEYSLAKQRVDATLAQLENYKMMQIMTAKEQSMAFRLRKLIIDSEYSLQEQIAQYKRNNKKDGTIPKDIEDKFIELDKQIKDLQGEVASLEKQKEAWEQQQAVENIKNSVTKKTRARSDKKAKAKAMIAEGLDDIAQFLGAIMKANGAKMPELNKALVKIGKGFIEAGEATLSDVFEKIKEAIKQKYGNNADVSDYEQDVIGEIKNDYANSFIKNDELKIPNKLLRNLVENGYDTIETLTEKVKDIISEYIPDVTERQVRDAITKYGKTIEQNKDDISVTLRKIKRIGQLVSKIEDARNSKRPKKTGLIRDEVTPDERAMQQELYELLKTIPLDEAESEKLYKTALDKVKKRLENSIEDVKKQLEEGKRTKKSKGIIYDDKANELLDELNGLRKKLDEKYPKAGVSYEQRLQMAKRAVKNAIEDYERRINSRNFDRHVKKELIPDDELKQQKETLDALRQQYKELYDASTEAETQKLANYKKQLDRKKAELERRLAEKDYEPRTKKQSPHDEEIGKKNIEIQKLQDQFEYEQEKNRIENMSGMEKLRDFVLGMLGIPRMLRTTIDLSAPFRQGIRLMAGHPILFAKAFLKMHLMAGRQKQYDDFMAKLRASKEYSTMLSAGLSITDATGLQRAREDRFLNNIIGNTLGKEWMNKYTLGIPSKLNYITFKASERGYTGFVNMMRVDVFLQGMEILEKKGVTIENNKEAYKVLAQYVNSATGRGDISSLGKSMEAFNAIFFSPRMLKSMYDYPVSILKTMVDGTIPKELKFMMAKDLISFIGFGIGALSLAAMAYRGYGGDDDDEYVVESDPRSSDFGKFKYKKNRYDIWAGYMPLVRTIVQLKTMEQKSIKDGSINKLDGSSYGGDTGADKLVSFLTNKLAPIPSVFWQRFKGKDSEGNAFEWKNMPKQLFVPMSIEQGYEGYSNDEVELHEAVINAVLNFYGVGVQRYGDNQSSGTKSGFSNKNPYKNNYKSNYKNDYNSGY